MNTYVMDSGDIIEGMGSAAGATIRVAEYTVAVATAPLWGPVAIVGSLFGIFRRIG